MMKMFKLLSPTVFICTIFSIMYPLNIARADSYGEKYLSDSIPRFDNGNCAITGTVFDEHEKGIPGAEICLIPVEYFYTEQEDANRAIVSRATSHLDWRANQTPVRTKNERTSSA